MVVGIIDTDKTLAIIFLMLSGIIAEVEMNPVKAVNTTKYWWFKPCNYKNINKLRHSREVRESVRIEINYTYQEIEKIYTNYEHSHVLNFNGSFLHQLKTKTNLSLKKMHKTLQLYAAAFYIVMNSTIKSDIDTCKRTKLLKPLITMKGHLQRLLCEIETAHINSNKKGTHITKIFPKKIKWYTTTMDCTKASTYQAIIIKKLKELLEYMKTQKKKHRRNSKSISSSSRSV